MTEHRCSPQPPSDALDELVAHLLAFGGVLSQIIAHMVRFDTSGKAAPDAAPIPDVAHSLISGISGPLSIRHSKRDIRVAAKIVQELTDEICEEIIFVPPELTEGAQPPHRNRRPSC